MAEKAKAPAIRFKRFTDAWEQRKLSDLCIKFTDGDWIESKDQSDSGVRLVQTGNVGVAEYLDKPNNRKWISEDTFERLHCEEVLPGDILISRLPEPAGRACIMPFLGIKMITAVDCTIVRTASDCSNKFLIQYLSSQEYFNEVNTALAGGTRQRISRSNLASFNIPKPVKYEEQEAMGNFFERLDSLITLHQRKFEKLQNVKKAMLEEMFPKNGSNVPEIRFSGFTDAWEQRKVGEVTEELDQYTTFQSGFPLLTSSRSGLMMQNEYRDNTSTDNQDTLFSIVPMGACTYRHMSDDDIFHFNINEIAKNGLVSREYPVFTASKGNNLFAVIQYLNSSTRFRAFCREQKMGGTRTRLYYKNLCKFELLLPSEKEQDQIAAVLKKLDNLITLHQRKLEKLKNIKKACLEKMFV